MIGTVISAVMQWRLDKERQAYLNKLKAQYEDEYAWYDEAAVITSRSWQGRRWKCGPWKWTT